MPDEKNKLRDLGLDVSHLNPRVKGCVMSALAQLDRIAKKPGLTRQDVTTMKI